MRNEQKIKLRLTILIMCFLVIISMMTISINGETKEKENLSEDYKDKLIRFHVLANSNSDEDQELKLKVRDAIINYLKPKLINSNSINESENIIKNEYDNLEKIARDIIVENGYNYEVKVGIDYSTFPTKQYSSIVLPAGEYKALRIIIGEGKGKNWWCVMFPPLCFVDEENGVIDKSTDDKLKEVLTKEEYELITQNNKNEDKNNIKTRVKVKSKISEVLSHLF